MKIMVTIEQYRDRSRDLTKAEWDYIVECLGLEVECNENVHALSGFLKLTGAQKEVPVFVAAQLAPRAR